MYRTRILAFSYLFFVVLKPAALGQESSSATSSTIPLSTYTHKMSSNSVRNMEMFAFDVPEDLLSTAKLDPSSQTRSKNATAEDDESLRKFASEVQLRRRLNEEFSGGESAPTEALPLVDLALEGDPVAAFIAHGTGMAMDQFHRRLHAQIDADEFDSAKNFWDSRRLDVNRLRAAQRAGVDAYVAEIERESGLTDQIFADASPDERSVALRHLGDFTLAANSVQINELKRDRQRDVSKVTELQKHVKALEEVETKSSGKQYELLVAVEQNSRALDNICTQLAAQGTDLRTIQEMLFGTIALPEQIKVMEHPGALGLSDSDRLPLLQNLERRRAIVTEAQHWHDFVTTGVDTLGILATISGDPQLMRQLQQDLVTANAIHGIVSSALTGNYIGATIAVFGLVGGGALDPESARHAEIMGKLNEIAERQKQILELEIKILNGLEALARLIWQNQRQLLSSLDNIYELQGQTLQAITAVAESPLGACTTFMNSRLDPAYEFIASENHFLHYADMQAHFLANWRNYQTCRQFLDNSIGLLSAANQALFGYPAISASSQERARVTAQYPTFKSWVLPYYSYITNFMDEDSVIESLFTPSFTYDQLFTKRLAANLKSAATQAGIHTRRLAPLSATLLRGSASTDNFYYDEFQGFLSAERVIRYSDTESAINNYTELESPSGDKLLGVEEMVKKVPAANHKGELRLAAAFDWLSVAIAQQAMLGGDYLLPDLDDAMFSQVQRLVPFLAMTTSPELTSLYDILSSTDRTSLELKRAHGQYLLGYNRLLAQNTLRYHIYRTLQAKGEGPTAYAFAWNMSKDPAYMKALLGDVQAEYRVNPTLAGVVRPSGWYVDYSYAEHLPGMDTVVKTVPLIPLPSPEEVQHKNFLMTPEMAQLIEKRQHVNELLSEYQALEQLEREDKQSIPGLRRSLLRHVEGLRRAPAPPPASR